MKKAQNLNKCFIDKISILLMNDNSKYNVANTPFNWQGLIVLGTRFFSYSCISHMHIDSFISILKAFLVYKIPT